MAHSLARTRIPIFSRLRSLQSTPRLIKNFSISSCRNMKLVQFTYPGKPDELRVGFVKGDCVVDVNEVNPQLPTTLIEILRCGLMDRVKEIESCNVQSCPLDSVRLAAPIHGMDKVLAIGLNYKDHCEEQNKEVPQFPMFFSKFASCVVGPNDPVELRVGVTQKVDWEVELVVVIGKTASNITEESAYDYVLGYTIAQDISARDWQKTKNGGQFLLGKSMDTFAPIGPWIVTKDEIPDPHRLNISCKVNKAIKQISNTEQLAHKIPYCLARLSSVMTLLPGDIILTGTPGGVGMYRDPPEYLKPGDWIHSEIECIGVLTTRVEAFKDKQHPV